jgi:hypothetical protein
MMTAPSGAVGPVVAADLETQVVKAIETKIQSTAAATGPQLMHRHFASKTLNGKADKVEGKIQNAVDGLEDALKR